MRLMRSGWFRVWVVASLVVWAAGIMAGLAHRDPWVERHDILAGKLPPVLLSRADLCGRYDEWLRERCELGSEAAPEPDPDLEAMFEGLELTGPSGSELLARATAVQWRKFNEHWRPYWPWALAPFGLGLLMIGIGWIRRGFVSTPPA